MTKELIVYTTANGKAPFYDWLQSFQKNKRTQTRITTRLERLKGGHYGQYKSVGKGVLELKLHFGSGYRIYFAEEGERIILLLCAGDKGTQERDINKAHAYWQEYQHYQKGV